MSASDQVTILLSSWTSGDKAALDQLIPLLYDELRRVADNHLRREAPGQTLQPTALVHETYIRLVSQHLPDWRNRSHFFAVAAQLMRQVLVDRARTYQAAKRGSGGRRVALEDTVSFAPERGADLLALDEALHNLAAIDPRKCKAIELRFFGGLDVNETARALDISVASVGRE
jgi:RNA polymerase sigma-70 factor (ECF subfamily)